MLKKVSLPICILFSYLLVLYVAMYTPMQSDDFPYSQIGLSFSKHYAHYLNWSGRVVADYISTLLLSTGSHTATAIINSAGSIALIYLISSLPFSLGGEYSAYKKSALYIFIFTLYIIANPNLGQVMFWVVGAANYTWTTMFILLSINLMLIFKRNNTTNMIFLSLLFFISILGGASNENTCITFVIINLCALIYFKLNSGKFYISPVVSTLGSIIGACIMLLAPGNYVRASDPNLDAWRNSHIFRKWMRLIYDTIPDVMAHNWVALVVLSVISIGLIYSTNSNKKSIHFAFIFIVAFIISNAVMIASPGYAERTMNGQFIFLLCSVSLIASNISKNAGIIPASAAFASMVVYFIPQYYSIITTYKTAYRQHEVRESLIHEAHDNGLKELSIPAFFPIGLLKKSDMFDDYTSRHMAGYYDMHKITSYPVGFDYSSAWEECKFPVNKTIYKNTTLKCVYYYKNAIKGFTVVIAEFDRNLSMNNDIKAYVKPIVKGKIKDKNTSIPIRTVNINGRYFSYTRIPEVIDFNHISVGAYSTKTGEVLSRFDF
ncbi:DUF6056 family protein [Pseudocitrobacter faecalis]|uniref:Glucosyltransferase GtrII-like protein n=1 Tax=Pseudocitrobacter faecalis TaxID=1398493 RepID=A0ABX9G0V2_9ENTR|nr:hypothetical protein DFQ50_104133 [Pseudocitrobacter faecalis]